ncbi:MAG: oligosaccharide flippase family protein [Nitrospirae bacterium]|nr:oligosaccharide flippase family protein [Nitrospirota bacterium]
MNAIWRLTKGKKALIHDTVWQLLNHIGGRIAIFLLFIYYARHMSVDKYALVSVFAMLQGLFTVLFDGGMNVLTVNNIAVKEALPRALIARRLTWIAGTVVLTVACLVVYNGFLQWYEWALLIVSSAALSVVNLLAFSCRGLQHPNWEATITLTQKFGSVLLCLVLAWVSWVLPHWILVGNIMSSLVAIVVALSLWKGRQGLVIDSPVSFTSLDAFFIMVVELGGWVYFRVDVLLLKQMAGMHETGLYGAAYNLFVGLTVCSNTVMAVFMPRIAKGHEYRRKWTLRCLAVLVGGALLSVIFLIPLSGRLITMIYGTHYAGSSALFAGLVISTLFMFPNNLLNYLAMLGGKSKVYALIVCIGVIVNIGINFAAIPHWKAFGAVAATIATEMIIFFCMLTVVLTNWKGIMHAHRD